MKADWNGNFDIIFPGATLNCNNEKRINALKDYAKDTRCTFMVSLDNCSSEQDLLDAILYNTTYYHESRHVHDYLLCPILNYGYRLRMLTVLHAVQALLKWDADNPKRFNILPIPIQNWFRLSDEEKREYIEEWSTSTLKANTCMTHVNRTLTFRDFIEQVSNMSELDHISALMLWASGYYEVYDSIMKPHYDIYHREYSVTSLLEASAISTQFASVQILFGERWSNSFWKMLVETTKRENRWRELENSSNIGRKSIFTNYTVVLSYIGSYLKYNRTIGYENLFIFTSYLVNWCLSGNLLSVEAETSPAVRLNKFVENDFGKGITIKDIEDDPLSVFNYWDSKLGCDGLNYHDYFSNNRQTYEQISDGFKSIGMNGIAEYVKMICDASQVMTSVFFKNPNQYLNPAEYICNFLNYVNVPVRFELSEPIEMVKTDKVCIELDEYLKKHVFNENDKVVQNITIDTPVIFNPNNQTFATSKFDILSHKKSEQFKTWFRLSDGLFRDESSVDIDKICNEILKNCHIRYIY